MPPRSSSWPSGIAVLALAPAPAAGVDIADGISLSGVAAGVYQRQSGSGVDDAGAGAIAFQPALSIAPTDRDLVHLKLGLATGDGLAGSSDYAFVLAPWAADLEAGLEDINGSDRDHLLTAWYRRRFVVGRGELRVSGGLVDATDYLDDNAYANDEYHQFLNEAFVNAAGVLFPSYDLGVVLEWESGPLAVDAVGMHVEGNRATPDPTIGERFQGQEVQYGALQLSYRLATPVGDGTYRLIVDRTSRDLARADGTGTTNSSAVLVSLDQQLGSAVGVFLRAGTQLDEASIRFGRFASAGAELHGLPRWRIGIGLGQLGDGNQAIESATAAEVYARWDFARGSHLTLDLQRLEDEIRGGDRHRGWVMGTRLTTRY